MTDAPAIPRISYPLGGATTPARTTPPRLPGSIRRTSTMDTAHPEGPTGPVLIQGRARDLLTGPDGQPGELGTASLTVLVGPEGGREIRSFATLPLAPQGDTLVGVGIAGGYRSAMEHAFATDSAARTLLYLLLDGLPIAVMLSSVPLMNARLAPERSRDGAPRANICAGWVAGGAMLTAIEEQGNVPLLDGPFAPALECEGDPIAWHDLPSLPPVSLRRRRRLDLIAGDPLRIEVHFRDSTRWPNGQETVLHEFAVRGTLEPGSLRFLTLDATANVLPWIECPTAAASAPRLVGTNVHDLRSRVRAEFTGISTCTHLNDTLRSLEDIATLAPALDRDAQRRGN